MRKKGADAPPIIDDRDQHECSPGQRQPIPGDPAARREQPLEGEQQLRQSKPGYDADEGKIHVSDSAEAVHRDRIGSSPATIMSEQDRNIP